MPGLDRLLRHDLDALGALGLTRALEPLSVRAGPVVELSGPRGRERLINFSSNDYLGLAGDPRLAAALAKGAHEWGTGAGASRLVTGDFEPHQELERAVAEFEGTEAALLFGSGYAANCGLVPALCGAGDVIFSDALNHASLIDGCRLSRARVERYAHCDVAALDALLAKETGAHRRLVLTETLFSMDGDRAPLAALAEVCARRKALLVVDEAHASGVFGPRGAGLVAELGLPLQIDARMGTFSKALGVVGAHVSGSRLLREWLINRARTLVFSTALPPAVAVAALEALRLVSGPEGDERRARLWRNVKSLTASLTALGIDAPGQSPIAPIVLGTAERAMAAMAKLRERGVLVKAIRPPTVPDGTSRLRVVVTAAHTDAHLEALVSGLRDALA